MNRRPAFNLSAALSSALHRLSGAFMLVCGLGIATIFQIAAAQAEPVLFDVAQAAVSHDQRTAEPIVTFRLTEASARAFTEFTGQNIGRVAEIRVHGKVLARIVIRAPTLGGSGQIPGLLSEDAARDLAAALFMQSPQAFVAKDVPLHELKIPPRRDRTAIEAGGARQTRGERAEPHPMTRFYLERVRTLCPRHLASTAPPGG